MADLAISSSTTSQECHNSILKKLEAQPIALPDFNALINDWPKEVNPGVDQLRLELDAWLDAELSHNSKRKALKAADFAYFASTWWPRAPFERLRIVSFLATWIFAWDDEIDQNEGAMWTNFDLANPYRKETLGYVRACLGLIGDECLDPPRPKHATIRAFGTIGTVIRKRYNYDQRQRIMNHVTNYINMTHQEQTLRLRDAPPSLEEYWSYRLGSSAVNVTLSVSEFAWDNRSLPKDIMEDGDMKLLWKYTNFIISAVNDILSLKKEIAEGNIGNMVPVLFAETGDAQKSMDQTMDFITRYMDAFNETAQRLQSPKHWINAKWASEVNDMIKSCQFYFSGNIMWGLRTKRYGFKGNVPGTELANGKHAALSS